MSVDIRLLQCIKNRVEFNKLKGVIPVECLGQETRSLVQDIEEYYKKFEHSTIDSETFMSWVFMFRHRGITDDAKTVYTHLIRKMLEDPPDGVKEAILSELHELRLATSIGNAVQKWHDGELPRMPDILSQIMTRYKSDAGCTTDSWIQEDIENLLEEVKDNRGIKWRLNSLNKCMRGLRPGDMGIVAARPDKGKTTFFVSEMTHMAIQLPEDKNILWLNNEGLGRRIIPRLYQAAIGCPLSTLYQKCSDGTLKTEYKRLIGRLDKIRVHDIHGLYVGQVERLIEDANAGIVVIDMIDHIKGFRNESGARTDLQLEEMYKWFREKSVQLEFIGLASSQISVEGDGLQFPPLSALKDSKTGKQGACDFQLMIGSRNEDGWNGYRYLSLPKNKLRREGAAGDPRCEVIFNPEIARYQDLSDDTGINSEEML